MNQECFYLSAIQHVSSCFSFQHLAISKNIIHTLRQLPLQNTKNLQSPASFLCEKPSPWLQQLADFCVSDSIKHGFREDVSQIQSHQTTYNYTLKKYVWQSTQWIFILALYSGFQKWIHQKTTITNFADHHNFLKHLHNHYLIWSSQELYEVDKAGIILILKIMKLGSRETNYVTNSPSLARVKIPVLWWFRHITQLQKPLINFVLAQSTGLIRVLSSAITRINISWN